MNADCTGHCVREAKVFRPEGAIILAEDFYIYMPADKPSPESLVRISAAANAADVSKQTIEYYLMLGLIEPVRLEGRHGRFFDDELIKRIRLIRELNKSGYTLRDIRETYLSNR